MWPDIFSCLGRVAARVFPRVTSLVCCGNVLSHPHAFVLTVGPDIAENMLSAASTVLKVKGATNVTFIHLSEQEAVSVAAPALAEPHTATQAKRPSPADMIASFLVPQSSDPASPDKSEYKGTQQSSPVQQHEETVASHLRHNPVAAMFPLSYRSSAPPQYDFIYAFDVFPHVDLHTVWQYLCMFKHLLAPGESSLVLCAS